MKTIQDIREERTALVQEAKDLVNNHPDDKWTPEVEAKYQDLKKGIEAKNAEIKRREEVDALPVDDNVPANSGARVTPAHGRQGPFASFGEQLLAIRDAGLPSGRVDERLLQVMDAAGDGSATSPPSDGGYLVQTDFANEVFKRMYDNSQVLSRCAQRTISSGANSIEIPGVDETSRADGSRYGGVRAYWAAEEGQYTSSKPKFEKIKLEPRKLTALYFASDEILADAGMLAGEVAEMFPAEIDFKVQDALINGDGVKKPLGIMSAGCKIAVSAESGQASTTILYENIVKMWARMWAKSRTNAVWFINQDIEPQLFTMSLAVGTGGIPVYLPAGGASVAPYGTLMGKPVIPIEQCQTLGTEGDIILADMGQYVVARKGGIRSAESIHLKFDFGQVAFRWDMRIDGQPRWISALTPFKGSNTQSPIITLATR